MRFALISSDPAHMVRYRIDPERGDATSFLNWIDVWQGFQFNFGKLNEEGYDVLRNFDVVMMSGNPYYVSSISVIARFLKDTSAVSMFWPEGSLQLYDNSINGFHREYYDAWNACDVVSSAEEDKLGYYRAFIRSEAIVRFIHVPVREEMERGEFMIPRIHKDRKRCVVYGDNNPNHPMVALAAAARMGMDVMGVDIDRGKSDGIMSFFPGMKIMNFTKISTYPFLRLLGRSFIHFYPTEWIGTAREQVSCAVAGTPCIGNHDSHTQRRLFPDLGCDIYDVDRMVELAERLSSDESFYDYVAARAFEGSLFYGIQATKKRFAAAVEDARRIKNRTAVAT